MKVLFAVSNEEVTESIVKKYQKQFKQIISYKNVYYFNAILKELQKDKTYDRVVISEELETFTHNQYEQIDKFIFEKLDGISDESSNSDGNDIPIIVICSDRREKGEQMLVKLFGIGVYNAIIGNDRSIDEVSRLINRPRTKKEAKLYYKIESEDVKYKAENENDVSEVEIQNILTHYKRLGKNEEKYIESFKNIAEQYNDTQLRVITKFLPENVRLVLEVSSPEYQKVMSFSNISYSPMSNKGTIKTKSASGKLLGDTMKPKSMTKPVVIPSSINMDKAKKISKQKSIEKEEIAEGIDVVSLGDFTDVEPPKKIEVEPEQEVVQVVEVSNEKKGRGRPKKTLTEEVQPVVKKGRGRPKKVQTEEIQEMEFEDVDSEILVGKIEKIESKTEEPIEPLLPGFEDIENEEKEVEPVLSGFQFQDEEDQETLLPGFEEIDNKEETALPGFQFEPDEENVLPGFEDEEKTIDELLAERTSTDEGFENSVRIQKEELPQNDIAHEQKPSSDLIKTANEYIPTRNLEMLLTSGKKIVSFVGTSKNGTSFIVNNTAELLSSNGIDVAILDTTKNKNSYYIYTKNDEELRNIAMNSNRNLVEGNAKGIPVHRNLTVYTALPNEEDEYINNVDEILETLLQKHTLVLIDADYDTNIGYFKQAQQICLVQSFDILTIQPLTVFLRNLKAKNILEDSKIRVILNKTIKIRGIAHKDIIGGMAFYNDPSMSYMTELFSMNTVPYISIPFETEIYSEYLQNIIECEVSINKYSKPFIKVLNELGNMIYPNIKNTSNGGYKPPSVNTNSNFSPSMNNTLEQMKKKY